MRTPDKYRQMEYADVLVDFAKLFNPRLYIEIGVKHGHTFNKVAPHCSRAIAVDIVRHSSVEVNGDDAFYQMCSEDFFDIWPHSDKADFIFIDADHRFSAVQSDIDNAKKIIKPYAGLIFMHDTYPVKKELLAAGYCGDAWRAAHAIFVLDHTLEIVTMPGPWAGMSILRYVPDGKHGWMD